MLTRYPLTDVSTGSARNERMSNWSTRVGVVLVRSLRTSSATVPSDSATISKSPSIIR